MTLDVILAPWNLLYIVPFTLALVYLGLFVFTGISFGDADADVDADVDADSDLQVEAHVVDHDVDADADSDVHAAPSHALAHASTASAHGLAPHLAHSVDHDAGEGATHSPFFAFLTLLGLGKIPFSLVLMVLCFAWGIAGFSLNALFMQWLGPTALIAIITLPLTIVIAFTLTGLSASAISKVIPINTRRERRQDLVGKSGEAIYDINQTFGMVNVRSNAGDLIQVPCRTPAGTPDIAKGTRVVLFDYDAENHLYHVAPFDA